MPLGAGGVFAASRFNLRDIRPRAAVDAEQKQLPALVRGEIEATFHMGTSLPGEREKASKENMIDFLGALWEAVDRTMILPPA